MLLISAEEAGALVDELEANAASVKNPSSWLLSAAEKVLKSKN